METTRIKRILVCLIIVILSQNVLADNGSNNPPKSDKKEIAVLHRVENHPIRKRMPSKDYLEISYQYGMITLGGTSEFGSYNITIKNCDNGEEATFQSVIIGDCINIELEYAEYSIIAEREDNVTFSGFLIIE